MSFRPGAIFGRRPLFVFHIFQMDLKCLDGNMDFPDGYSQGSDEQQESQSEDICRQVVQTDVDQKHGDNAEKQT